MLESVWSIQGLQGDSLESEKRWHSHHEVHIHHGGLWPTQISLLSSSHHADSPFLTHLLPSHNLRSYLLPIWPFPVTPTLLIQPPVSSRSVTLVPESLWPFLPQQIVFPKDCYHNISHHTHSSCTVTLTLVPMSAGVYSLSL